MKKIILALAVAGIALASTSKAHAGVSFSIGLPAPVVYAPAPVYYAPRPVYVQPAPVVVYRPSVYCAPAPVYYAPRYFAPRVSFGFGYGGCRPFYGRRCW